MTILKRMLVFNKPIEEVECMQCKGSGKVRTSPTSSATGLYLVLLGTGLFMTLLDVITKQRMGDAILFSFFFILAALTLMEIKEQNARV